MRLDPMILDVGCGNNPRGDVNVDLYPDSTVHRGGSLMNVKRVPNFIRADIHNLPFKEEIFESVFCYSVLEHKGVDFVKALDELYRVSKVEVKIMVPHRFYKMGFFRTHDPPAHDKYFTCKQLEKLLRALGYVNFRFRPEWGPVPGYFLRLIWLKKYIYVTIEKSETRSLS